MRHDFEKAICDTIVAYLAATLDAELIAAAPVVAFYDPMSIDDAHRIIVECINGETKLSGPGNAICTVSVSVKTLVAQPTMATDITTHFDRVNCIRDVFTVDTIDDDLDTYAVSGLVVTRVESERRFRTTQVTRDAGFIESDYEMQIHVNTEEE